jgi:hypothetical protein
VRDAVHVRGGDLIDQSELLAEAVLRLHQFLLLLVVRGLSASVIPFRWSA